MSTTQVKKNLLKLTCNTRELKENKINTLASGETRQDTYNLFRLCRLLNACLDMKWRLLFCRNLKTEQNKNNKCSFISNYVWDNRKNRKLSYALKILFSPVREILLLPFITWLLRNNTENVSSCQQTSRWNSHLLEKLDAQVQYVTL